MLEKIKLYSAVIATAVFIGVVVGSVMGLYLNLFP